MQYLFKEYSIDHVYKNINSRLEQEIIRLWIDHDVLNEQEANRRVAEVLFTIRNPAGELVGVTTAYAQDFMHPGSTYWFLRIFLCPQARGAFNLAVFVVRKTIESLREQKNSGRTLSGVIIVMENKKLWRSGMRKVLRSNGGTFWGKGPLGNEIWYERFDGCRINSN